METKKNGLALKDELTTQIMKRRDIRANSKLVLIGILNRVDWSTWKSSTGYKIVSQRDLADLCGTHLATVNSCIEQLEKVKLIERDVFKGTRTTAPPIKVNIELIQAYESKPIKRYKTKKKGKKAKVKTNKQLTQCDSVSLTGGDNESLSRGDSKTLTGGDSKTLTAGDSESITIINRTNSNSIINTNKITSVVGGEWGVDSSELWGDDLRKSLSVVPVKGESK